MNTIFTCVLVLSIFALLFFIFLFTLFSICFAPMKSQSLHYKRLPRSAKYKAVEPLLLQLIDELEKAEFEPLSIKSHDNLSLFGRYYKGKNDDVIYLCFHGYRSHAMRDSCGAGVISRDLNFSHIIVDQRAHGDSQGKVITLGIKERLDLLKWVEYIIERFGENVKIILTGVSMGAATVLASSELILPKNIIGIIADCPYTSPKEIITKMIKDRKLLIKVFYPAIRLSAKIFGGFDLESASPIEALKNTSIPVLIIHGDKDRFVPYYMGKECFDACVSENKRFVTIENAPHAISYLVDKEKYTKAVKEFIDSII